MRREGYGKSGGVFKHGWTRIDTDETGADRRPLALRGEESGAESGAMRMRFFALGMIGVAFMAVLGAAEKIDRQAVVTRHNPKLTKVDPWAPLTVGNGQFCFTADVTGLQTFYDHYRKNGIPLETLARWAWHFDPNPQRSTGRSHKRTQPSAEVGSRRLERVGPATGRTMRRRARAGWVCSRFSGSGTRFATDRA